MIALNLIPPKQKQEIKLRQFYIIIKNLTYVFLLFTIFIAVILMSAKAILQNNFNRIVADSTLVTRYGPIFNNEIDEFNKQLTVVSDIQANYISWSGFINELILHMPENTFIYSLGIDKINQQLTISGLSRTRDDLLKFKESLENFDLISGVDIPLESLLNKENINFEIKTTIDLGKMKNL